MSTSQKAFLTGQPQQKYCTINAKYLVGCDGAHSWVRAALGLKLEGVRLDEKWGVIDSIPLTDFREFENVPLYAEMKTDGKNNKPTFASDVLSKPKLVI